MRIHALSLAALLGLVGCANGEETSLEGTDLVASFGTGADSALLSVGFEGLDVTTGKCPIIPIAGVTFAGEAVAAEDVVVGGQLPNEATCAPPSVTITIEARDPAVDGELVIESGGGTVRWVATKLLATRGFVRAGDPSDQVPRSSIVRVNHVPETDVLGEPTSIVLTDDSEVSTTFQLDGSGVLVNIPGEASPGPQTLDITAPIEVPSTACEGFASCALKTEAFEAIPIVIAP